MNRQTTNQAISRRDFLHTAAAVGSLATVAPFLEACAPTGLQAPARTTPVQAQVTAAPTRTPTPAPTAPPGATAEVGMGQVAFVKTNDRVQGMRQAIELLDFNPVQGKRVLLKPNFNSADPTPGSTHIELLRALVRQLRDMGAQAITVADRSGMGDTRRTMEQLGIFELAQELGFDTLVLDELGEEDWVMVRPPDSHWRQGYPFARPLQEAEALVQTCCLKTHRFGGHFTLSLKNSVGMVAKYRPGDSYNYMNELHSSPHQRRMIAEINAAYTPALVVLDGVEAFVNGGPDRGKMVSSEVVLAGTDRIAIDAVGVAILRHFGTTPEVSRGPIFQQEQIARAVELGLGVDGPEKIQLLTPDGDSEDYAGQIREILMAG